MRFWYLRRRPEAIRDEVDEELRVHLEMRIEELQTKGLSPDDARRQAVRTFGDIEGMRRYCRLQDLEKENRVQRLLFLQDLAQDVRIGLRNLLRAPGPDADRRRHRRSWHRRNDRDLRGRQRGPSPAAAVQGSRTACPNLYRRPARQVLLVGCGLPRSRCAADPLRGDRRIQGARHGLQQRDDRGAADGPRGDVDLLPAARDHTGHRPRFHGTGRTAGQSARGRHQPWLVGAATGQPPRCRWTADSARWRRLHRCRHSPDRSSDLSSGGRTSSLPRSGRRRAGRVPSSSPRSGDSGKASADPQPPASCRRSIAASFRCGSRRTRTIAPRGV